MQQQPAAGRGRLADAWNSIPLATKLLLTANIVMFVVQNTTHLSTDAGVICLYYIEQPQSQWYLQLYRIVANHYFHIGLMHIVFNMMALHSLGTALEKAMGTMGLLGITVLFSFLIGGLYLAIEEVLFLVTHDPSWLYQCAVGFSGILFAWIMMEVSLQPLGQRSIFGFFTVPSWLYPIVLLVLISLFFHGVSWLGHLSGLIVGWLYCKGLLLPFTLPRRFVKRVEDTLVPAFVRNSGSYVPYPTTDPFTHSQLPFLRASDSDIPAGRLANPFAAIVRYYSNWRLSRQEALLQSGYYTQLPGEGDLENQQPVTIERTASRGRFTGGGVVGSRAGAPPLQPNSNKTNKQPQQQQQQPPRPTPSPTPSLPSYQQSLDHPTHTAPSAPSVLHDNHATNHHTLDNEEEQLRLALQRSVQDQ